MIANFGGQLATATPSTGRPPLVPKGHYPIVVKAAEDKPAKLKPGQNEAGMNLVLTLALDPSCGKAGQLTMYLSYPVPGTALAQATADRWAGVYQYLLGYSKAQYASLQADDPLKSLPNRTGYVRVWVTEESRTDATTGETKIYKNNDFVLIDQQTYMKGVAEDKALEAASGGQHQNVQQQPQQGFQQQPGPVVPQQPQQGFQGGQPGNFQQPPPNNGGGFQGGQPGNFQQQPPQQGQNPWGQPGGGFQQPQQGFQQPQQGFQQPGPAVPNFQQAPQYPQQQTQWQAGPPANLPPVPGA